MPRSIEIFLCYAREDEELRQGLEKHLRVLKRQGIINIWHDRNIGAGTEWEREIDTHLNTARLILLLISPDFLDSDYCYSKEMTRAMERHERGEARVIPIILHHVYWQKTPFGKLQALPKDGKPIVSSAWHTSNEALFNASEGIRLAVEEMIAKDEAKQFLNIGKNCYDEQKYEEAILAYKQALEYDPQCFQAHQYIGNAHIKLLQYKDAIAAFDEALQVCEDLPVGSSQIRSNRIEISKSLGEALIYLNRHQEALQVFERVFSSDDDDLNARISDLRKLLKVTSKVQSMV